MEHYKTLQLNKLGQRQSQTPFSSALEVKKVLGPKSSKKIMGPKNIGP